MQQTQKIDRVFLFICVLSFLLVVQYESEESERNWEIKETEETLNLLLTSLLQQPFKPKFKSLLRAEEKRRETNVKQKRTANGVERTRHITHKEKLKEKHHCKCYRASNRRFTLQVIVYESQAKSF